MTTRFTLTSFSALLLASVSAQPTLNMANNGPMPVGAPFAVSSYDNATQNYDSGSAGMDELYGFWMVPSTGVGTGNHDQFFVAPSVTPTSASIPGTTVISTDGGSDSTFWKVDATGAEQIGVRSALEGVVAFTDGAVELKYPCSFGTTWTDNFAASYSISGIAVTRAGTINGIADGYGTIQLPALEIPNVLRVKVRKVANDVSAIASIRRTFDTYYFYQEGVRFPLMMTSLDSVTISGGSPTIVFSMEWLYGAGSVGISDVAADQVVFTPYPNPTNGQLDLRASADVKDLHSVEVLNATGQLVMQVNKRGTASMSSVLDMSALPAGVYQVRVTQVDGRQGVRSVVLQ